MRHPELLVGANHCDTLPKATTTMTPDAALELSVEQLIDALNQKLFMECTQARAAMPPRSRALAATLTAKVRSRILQQNFGF